MKHIYKSINEQIEILKKNKSVVFNSKESEILFKNYLKHNNYVNVISPYKIYFVSDKIDGKHIYSEPVPIERYIKLHKEDIVDSHELLRIAFTFENKFRSIIAYFLSKNLSNNKVYFDDLKQESIDFASKNKKIQFEITSSNYFNEDVISKIKLQKLKLSNTEYKKIIKAYEIQEFEKRVMEKYKITDINANSWFYMINFITFEDLHFLFKVLDGETQKIIITNISPKEVPIDHFNKTIRSIKWLRNKLAHIENLTIIINKQLQTDSSEYIVQGKRAFNTIKAIYSMIDEDVNTDLTRKLEKKFNSRKNNYKKIGLLS